MANFEAEITEITIESTGYGHKSPELATHFINGEYVRVSDPRWILDSHISISELKRLVESVDLIGKYHSIDHAKNHYNNLRKAINQYENKDIGYLANELEQAITDYEAIYCVESIIEKREFDFGLAHDDEYVKTGDSNE